MGYDTTLEMEGELSCVHLFAAFYPKITTRLQGKSYQSGLARRQRQGLKKFDIFEFHWLVAIQFSGGGQGHFNGARSGQHNVGIKAVIRQKHKTIRVQDVFPHPKIRAQSPSEQGMGRGLSSK